MTATIVFPRAGVSAIGMGSGSRLTMITAAAPAFWALLTLTAKSHTPRAMRTVLPATLGVAGNAVQPSRMPGTRATGSPPVARAEALVRSDVGALKSPDSAA